MKNFLKSEISMKKEDQRLLVFMPGKFIKENSTVFKLVLAIGGTTVVLPHKTVSFDHWLTHIRVQHLVLCSSTLESNTWSRVEPH